MQPERCRVCDRDRASKLLEEKKDPDTNIQAFKKVVKSFLGFDMEDQQELKLILQRLIDKIEVFKGGEIAIYHHKTASH